MSPTRTDPDLESSGGQTTTDPYPLVERELSLLLSLRQDAYSRAGSSASPRAAIVYAPGTSSTIKLLYGMAFRAPNTYELYYQDAASKFLPGKDIQPEHIHDLELVLGNRLGKHLDINLTGFVMKIDHLIDQVFSPADSTTSFENAHGDYARGCEGELIGNYSTGVGWYLRYTYEYATSQQSGGVLTNAPLHLGRMGSRVRILPYLHFSVEAMAESGRLTVNGTTTDPLVVANANVTYAPSEIALRVQLGVRNLFNAPYAYPGGFEHIQNDIMQDGRTWWMTLSYAIPVQ